LPLSTLHVLFTTQPEKERMLGSSLVFCTLLGPEGPGSFAG